MARIEFEKNLLVRGGLVVASLGLALFASEKGSTTDYAPAVITPYQESSRLTEAESLEITKQNLHKVLDWISSQNQDELQNLKENFSKDLEDLEDGMGLLKPMSTLGPDYARVVSGGPVSDKDKTKYEIGISVYKFSSGEFDVDEAALALVNAYRDLQSTSLTK